jgi:hypothetical protein
MPPWRIKRSKKGRHELAFLEMSVRPFLSKLRFATELVGFYRE